jgi:hypothetical protein
MNRNMTIMKNKKVKLSATILLVFGLTGMYAQKAITVSGGNAKGSGGSVSYTIGQLVYTTNKGTNGSVAQGVQQSFEISVVTTLEEAKDITLQCSAYPNPTTDFLTLRVENNDNYSLSTLSFTLFDINGKLILNQQVESTETIISMENLLPATYFLRVVQTSSQQKSTPQEFKIFKIIKTN